MVFGGNMWSNLTFGHPTVHCRIYSDKLWVPVLSINPNLNVENFKGLCSKNLHICFTESDIIKKEVQT